MNLSNIFKTLVDNNAFFNNNKITHHREHAVDFFADINPKITLRDNLRQTVQDHLASMNIDDKKNESL